MRKVFLLFAALFVYGAMSYAQQANIYASGLSAGTVSENNEVSFTYTLNADATSLNIQILNEDGTTAKTIPLTEATLLTKGAHTATVTVDGLATGLYAWSVTATAAANLPAGVYLLSVKTSEGTVVKRFVK
jgi:flagellar hook assembly protein FlgD